jgi:hypothetical protein
MICFHAATLARVRPGVLIDKLNANITWNDSAQPKTGLDSDQSPGYISRLKNTEQRIMNALFHKLSEHFYAWNILSRKDI